ncbi:MAG: hypothetical protein ACRDIX_10335 [Actinomycetota bacterium]
MIRFAPLGSARGAPRSPRLVGRLGLLAAAASGVVAGHLLTYVIAVADHGVRDALLRDTGHLYWGIALAAGLALGLWTTAALVARNLHGGLRGKSPISDRLRPLVGKIAFLQVGIFLALELNERLVSGAPLHGLLEHNLLTIGLIVQILVAVGVAAVLRILARAAYAIGRALHGSTTHNDQILRLTPRAQTYVRPVLVAGSSGVRSPPSS